MKYAIIIPDGAADEPQESLGGKTPLEAAHVPAMDRVAAAGVVGRSNNVPISLPPGSDVANLSLLGYNPLEHFTGRAPLEAAAQGIQLGPEDWAARCNLVTIEDQIMRDFTAGHISTEEASRLMATVQEELGNDRIQFYSGVSYRNLMVYRAGDEPPPFSPDTRTTPPHDLTDKPVLDDYPRGPGSDLLSRLMSDSVELFARHPVNEARRRAGRLPATNIWLWGLGRTPQLESFAQRFGCQGAMITAVDLLRGLAALVGWRRIDVPGATAYLDTDYAAKGRYAVEALEQVDLVCVHVEAPDEASHEGDAAAKVQAIEQIDRHIVGPVYAALRRHGDHRILVSPDHPTALRTKTHSHGYVPLAMAGAGIEPDEATRLDDPTAARSELVFEQGWELMDFFLGRSKAGPGA
ncbi:MAG TPA: cofactor-independent phosphoglycerate mutase [Planctomycetaceae bacterium]|nr:cofactor-independent phosphoglycerate mutase [Planctomycetaceae bacterium]HIQ19822.1 cofactor-independent phosphoglycerate mutase [Planctomycetota bacterium]